MATVIAAGALAFVSVVSTVAASGPTFNIFPIDYTGAQNTDYPLLDGRNVTKGGGWSTSQAVHDAGVTADPGDELEFLVYYHNGAPDDPSNTATNVVIAASLPSASATNFTVGASISASNAQTVTSAQKGGDMTVRLTGSVSQTLSLEPGTTIWLPNRGITQQVMPDTIASGGINIGDIRGCWNFAGFVKFRVKVSASQPTVGLSMLKQVRNVTKGETTFVSQTNADPTNVVEFQLTSQNTGQAQIGHVIFKDTLPANLSFNSGSLQTSQPILSGDLFNGGLDLGALSPGNTVTVKFQGTVADASHFPVGTTNLDNTANVSGQSPTVNPISATARVVVNVVATQQCTITAAATLNGSPFSGAMNYSIFGPATITGTAVPMSFTNEPTGTYTPSYQAGGPTGATLASITPASGTCTAGGTLTFTFNFTRASVVALTVNKQVRNITTGTGFAPSVAADPSQTVEFRIVVTNSGNSDANQVTASDAMPANMTFTPGSLTVNGAASNCDTCFFTGSLQISQILPAGSSVTIVFQAVLAGQNAFPVGTTTLVNTVSAQASNAAQQQSSASVVVTKAAPVKENGTAPPRP